jgi:hypothetical protein
MRADGDELMRPVTYYIIDRLKVKPVAEVRARSLQGDFKSQWRGWDVIAINPQHSQVYA